MYNNGQTELKTESEVLTEDSRQNAAIKSNLDKILHYERYRNGESVAPEVTSNATSAVEEYFRRGEAAQRTVAPEIKESVAAPRVEEGEDLRPSATTMQFESAEESDLYEDLDYKRESKAEENFRISSKGKMLIAIYSAVVILILSLIIINARMLKSLDGSLSTRNQRVNELQKTYERVNGEYSDAMSDEAIDAWAKEHGMQKAA